MSTAAYTMLSTSSMPQSPRTPTQATSMSDEQMDLVDILRSGEDSRLRRHRTERSAAPTLPAVVLFCGADQEIEADWDEHRPWVVEMLPETQPPPPRKRQKRSNGCGVRIHTRAVPDRRWSGQLDGVSPDVVALEDKYFTPDMRREIMLGKDRCGCARSGVGCAICGNPLGALFTPCTRHNNPHSTASSTPPYTFLRAAVSPPLPAASTRRVSIPADDILGSRGEREALQRRIRDREELQQLRARMRAAAARPPRTGEAEDNRLSEMSRLFATGTAGPPARRDRERLAREGMALTEHIAATRASDSADGREFEAWVDSTIQRATATAASDVPVVVDLSALMDSATPPEPATARRELSEEERRRDWQQQRNSLSATSRSFGRDWPPAMSRTIERTTAIPESLSRRTPDEVLWPISSTTEETEEQKEETVPTRTFFER
ncbi:hypothetical protein C8R43DRAFT_953718 [Mycena crocata]|nr:hypothetical protein C8R43DRAFT_953718 [Mycena crocata]